MTVLDRNSMRRLIVFEEILTLGVRRGISSLLDLLLNFLDLNESLSLSLQNGVIGWKRGLHGKKWGDRVEEGATR